MEKNRLFIIISAAVAILSSFLPWASLNAGNFGSYSWNGLRGDGWFVIIFAVVAIVLACLNDVKSSSVAPDLACLVSAALFAAVGEPAFEECASRATQSTAGGETDITVPYELKIRDSSFSR